jgi:WhiB family redox-sensing transcriptional regulator
MANLGRDVMAENIGLKGIFSDDYPDFSEFGSPLCAESFPDAFFPEDSNTIGTKGAGYRYEREAKALCEKCPYRDRCLAYALKNGETYGIWGGTTEHQRRLLRRTLKRKSLLF